MANSKHFFQILLFCNLLLISQSINNFSFHGFNYTELVLEGANIIKSSGDVRVEYFKPRRTEFHIHKACYSEIESLALSQDGNLLAIMGTFPSLVRIYHTRDGNDTLVQQVSAIANIYSMTFSLTCQWLTISSDNGTTHVVKLIKDTNNSTTPPNPFVVPSTSSLSFIRGQKYIVGFGGQENTLVIIGLDGSYYRCNFDPQVTDGEMTILEHQNFLKH